MASHWVAGWLWMGWACAAILTMPRSAHASAPVNASNEVAEALYEASATQEALDKQKDAVIVGLRRQVGQLAAKAKGRKRADTLAAAQRATVAALEARDADFARAIEAFRDAVTDIATTPEGVKALAAFNDGREVEALAMLDRLVDAQAAMDQRVVRLKEAARRRRVATLALEARSRGKVSTTEVAARYETLTELDPDVHRDWVKLGRLYTDLGRLEDAQHAAERSAATAGDDRDRSVALNELGNVLVAQGRLDEALTNHQKSLDLSRRLAEADPSNTEWQRDLSVSFERVGDVLVAQGRLDEALANYQTSLDLGLRLAEADPSNARWQRDLSVSLDKVGNVLAAQGQLREASARRRPSDGSERRACSVGCLDGRRLPGPSGRITTQLLLSMCESWSTSRCDAVAPRRLGCSAREARRTGTYGDLVNGNARNPV